MRNNDEKVTMLDDNWGATEIELRHLEQDSRTDYETRIVKATIYEIISVEEACSLLNISLLELYRKQVIYLGSDPELIEKFEECFGEPF